MLVDEEKVCELLQRVANGEADSEQARQFRDHLPDCVDCQAALKDTVRLQSLEEGLVVELYSSRYGWTQEFGRTVATAVREYLAEYLPALAGSLLLVPHRGEWVVMTTSPQQPHLDRVRDAAMHFGRGFVVASAKGGKFESLVLPAIRHHFQKPPTDGEPG